MLVITVDIPVSGVAVIASANRAAPMRKSPSLKWAWPARPSGLGLRRSPTFKMCESFHSAAECAGRALLLSPEQDRFRPPVNPAGRGAVR